MAQSDHPSEGSNPLSFEEAIKSLEDIVLGLEEGEVELDSLVTEYKNGVTLLKYCRSKVQSAEVILKEVSEPKPTSTENISDDK